eukprot:10150433-Alexandrium_andersonii.AAC.1
MRLPSSSAVYLGDLLREREAFVRGIAAGVDGRAGVPVAASQGRLLRIRWRAAGLVRGPCAGLLAVPGLGCVSVPSRLGPS